MDYSYVGLIKKNTNVSKVLVCSTEGRYYVWETNNSQVEEAFLDSSSRTISPSELKLATPRQIEVGRGSLWTPNQSKVMVEVYYYGIVSGGKANKSILVRLVSGDPVWYVIPVSSDSLVGVKMLNRIFVDFRNLSPARQDQIDAGLNYGKLRRKKRTTQV